MGDEAESDRLSIEALELACGYEGVDLVNAVFFERIRRTFATDAVGVLQAAEKTLALSEKYGLPLYEACGHVLRGWAGAMSGSMEAGVTELEDGLAAFRNTRTKMFEHFFLGLLADGRRRAGRVDAAILAVEEALAEVQATGERFWEAELHRLRGELISGSGPHRAVDAVASFERALTVAQAQGARALERRVTDNLARRTPYDVESMPR